MKLCYIAPSALSWKASRCLQGGFCGEADEADEADVAVSNWRTLGNQQGDFSCDVRYCKMMQTHIIIPLYMNIITYIYIRIYIYTYTYIHIYIYICTCMYKSMFKNISKYMTRRNQITVITI